MARRDDIFRDTPTHRLRRFLFCVLGLLLAAVFFVVVVNLSANSQPEILRQKVSVENLPSDLENWTILHISDLRGARFGDGQKKLQDLLGRVNVSVIVFSGDMLGEDGDAEPFLELVAALPRQTVKLCIPGDGDPDLYCGTAHNSLSVYSHWAEQMMEAGVTFLDEPVSFTREKGGTIVFLPEYLYSLDIPNTMSVYQRQLDALNSRATSLTADDAARKRLLEFHLARLERTREVIRSMTAKTITVAVSHAPLSRTYVREMVQQSNPDSFFTMRRLSLVLAGHYAGGQWRLPGGGAVYMPELGFFPDDAEVTGLSFLSGVQQYISPGLGECSDAPFWMKGRLFNKPSVTILTLSAK